MKSAARREKNAKAQLAYQAKQKEHVKQLEQQVKELEQQLQALRAEGERLQRHGTLLQKQIDLRTEELLELPNHDKVLDCGPPLVVKSRPAYGPAVCQQRDVGVQLDDRLLQAMAAPHSLSEMIESYQGIIAELRQLTCIHDDLNCTPHERAKLVHAMQQQHHRLGHLGMSVAMKDPMMIQRFLLHAVDGNPLEKAGLTPSLVEQLRSCILDISLSPAEVSLLLLLRTMFNCQCNELLLERRALVQRICAASVSPDSVIDDRACARATVQLHDLLPKLQKNLLKEHMTVMQLLECLFTRFWSCSVVPTARYLSSNTHIADELLFVVAIGVVHGRLDIAGKPVKSLLPPMPEIAAKDACASVLEVEPVWPGVGSNSDVDDFLSTDVHSIVNELLSVDGVLL